MESEQLYLTTAWYLSLSMSASLQAQCKVRPEKNYGTDRRPACNEAQRMAKQIMLHRHCEELASIRKYDRGGVTELSNDNLRAG